MKRSRGAESDPRMTGAPAGPGDIHELGFFETEVFQTGKKMKRPIGIIYFRWRNLLRKFEHFFTGCYVRTRV